MVSSDDGDNFQIITAKRKTSKTVTSTSKKPKEKQIDDGGPTSSHFNKFSALANDDDTTDSDDKDKISVDDAAENSAVSNNALELSAPATPVLLQQQQKQYEEIKKSIGWVQLSGHPDNIVSCSDEIVGKRVKNSSDYEVLAYQQLSKETQASKIVPKFHGCVKKENNEFIELQNLLKEFKDPCVMDIKMGCRTYLESEVNNEAKREDLYEKMMKVDALEPTEKEHKEKAITKARYMAFREAMSSSQSKGFRIDALKLKGKEPIKDLKTVRTDEDINRTIEKFVNNNKSVQKELLKRLRSMRNIMENSRFFQTHEVVGSSIFIVHDDSKVGCWLIDFAKCVPLDENIVIDHRSEWTLGNHEEGLLKGMDELIRSFEFVYNKKQ